MSMAQWMKNIIRIFIVPFVVGLLLRLFIRKKRNAYLLTVFAIFLALFAWIAAYLIPNHGSEIYGILAMMVTMFASGTILSEIVCRVISEA